jgi:hypothetical protein
VRERVAVMGFRGFIESHVCLLLAASMVAGCASPKPRWVDPQREKSAPIELGQLQAGRNLRAAIERDMKSSRKPASCARTAKGRNFITDVVEKYIQPGMTWRNAKATLEAAGFEVGEIGEHPLFRHGVYANIESYDGSFITLTSVSVDAAVQLDTTIRGVAIVRSIESSITLMAP